MKLKITKYKYNDITRMNSYHRYNFFVDGHYLAAVVYDSVPSIPEVYDRAYNYIIEHPGDVLNALRNDKITIKDCAWLNKEDILETELVYLELDRKKLIIRKKLAEIEKDFV